MKTTWSVLGLAAWLAVAGGCQDDASTTPTATTKPAEAQSPRVELLIGRGSEDWGKILLELYESKAPVTVGNFLRYVQEGYYDGTVFHRVIPGFMIQGGGFTAPGKQKTDGLHESIRNESTNGLRNTRGTISMARTSEPHSATSQFFINVANNVSGSPHDLDAHPPRYGYAVFGQVVEGIEIADRIVHVETKPQGEKSEPVDPPVLRKARVVK